MDDTALYVGMPDALLPSSLPNGWTVVHEGDPLSLTGPESDLNLSFFSRTTTDQIEGLVRTAWQEIQPGFDVPVRQMAEMPTPDGWDKTVQIIYNTPASQSRIVMAMVRMLSNRAYISLIDGTKAAFSRRMAQIAELTNEWKPAGLKEPSLAGIRPNTFGEDEHSAMSDLWRQPCASLASRALLSPSSRMAGRFMRRASGHAGWAGTIRLRLALVS